jgi:hypothetical protein
MVIRIINSGLERLSLHQVSVSSRPQHQLIKVMVEGVQPKTYNEQKHRHEGTRFSEVHPWLSRGATILLLFAVVAFVMGSWKAAEVIRPPAQPSGIGISPQ